MKPADPEPDTAAAPRSRGAAALVLGVAVVGGLTVLAVIALWPRGSLPRSDYAPRTDFAYVDATILGVETSTYCDDNGIDDNPALCRVFAAELGSGDSRGDVVPFTFSPSETALPDLERGDRVVLLEFADAPLASRYYFHDYQRTWPLLWLAAAFVIAVVGFAGLQGARALAGMALSIVILALFIVPALMQGSPALPVALAGAAAVAYLAVYLSHGFGLASSIALAGTLVSLTLTAGLALIMASLAQISGLAGDEAPFLRAASDALDLRGLLVAGIVIGALGVLDDMTVSQVSTVAALRRTGPHLPRRRIYGEAVRVGRDHVAAAVNTLVLAYAGAALPLLLLFTQGTGPVGRLLTGELVAVEIIRMLVGSIGLILSVPITTALAVLILVPPTGRHPAEQPPTPPATPPPIPAPAPDRTTRRPAPSVAATAPPPSPRRR